MIIKDWVSDLLKDGWNFDKPKINGMYKIVNDSFIEQNCYFTTHSLLSTCTNGGTWWSDNSMREEMYSDEQGVPICWKPIS